MKPTIVILSTFLSPNRSGAEACAEEVPLALVDQYNFTIVTARMSRDLPRHDMLQGKVPVLRIGFGCAYDKWLYPFIAPFVVGRLRPQVVHAVLESFAGLALVFCRVLSPWSKTLLTCQSTNTSFLVRFMHWFPHRMTAISSVLIHRAHRFGRHDIQRIPNGISLQEIQTALQKNSKVPGRLLFVGRLRAMKGVDVLLRAFAKVCQHTDKELHLRLVGEGELRSSLETLARDLGIDNQIEFMGYLSSDRVHKEFAEAEIFCALSRHEALGNVFLEAQAASCAILGTSVEGIPDIVEDNVTGLLVPSDNVDAAVGALQRLIDDVALREKLAHRAKDHAQQYNWPQIARQYADIYGQLAYPEEAENLFLTQLFYDEYADDFEKNTVSLHPQKWIDAFAELLPSQGRILDVGCGFGRDSSLFVQRGFTITGIDFSRILINRAKTYEPHATFLHQDIRKLDVPAESFDGIWASHSLLHLPKKDLSDVLKKIHNALKQNGFLYLSMKKGEGEGLESDARYKGMKKYYSYYKQDELSAYVQKAGFTIRQTGETPIESEYQNAHILELIAQKS